MLIGLTVIGVIAISSQAMIEGGQISGNGIAIAAALREYAKDNKGTYPTQLRDEAFLRFLSDRPRRFIATSQILYSPPGPASSQHCPVLIISGNVLVRVITFDARCLSLRDAIALQGTEMRNEAIEKQDALNP
jgi:hypothetical protein